ncbi:MAG: glutathione S-transferase family protein [Rhizobiaceae bacterium]
MSADLGCASTRFEKPVLTGKFLSPFVRRVAVTLNHFDIAFDRQVLSAIHDVADMERSNPIGRVPALILASGETLIDSAAILDHLDEQVGRERALVPGEGPTRRRTLYLLALICGTIERAMTANAERRRPESQRDDARLARLLRQTGQGFEALERELARRSSHATPWFQGERMLQADLTTAVGQTFVDHIFPELLPKSKLPNLSALTAICEALPAFQSAKID